MAGLLASASASAGTNGPSWSGLPRVDLQSALSPSGVCLSGLADGATRFDFSLTLESWGRTGEVRPVESAQIDSNRDGVFYRRRDLVEWYYPGAHGLAQGFTVERPASGREDCASRAPLELSLRLRSSLSVALSDDARGLKLLAPSGMPALSYEGLAAWDSNGRELPARLSLEGERLAILVDDQDAVYPIVIDPLLAVEQAKLLPATSSGNDQFGWSVAIDGDDAVVGAYLANVVGIDSGAAHVYARNGTTWSLVALLTPSDLAPGDQFGSAVAIDGDTLVVGANLEDHAFIDVGAAYVFVRSGTSWTEQAKLTPSDGLNHDHFGSALAIHGNTIVVGSPEDDSPLSQAGSAYVFVRTGQTWTQQGKLVSNDAVSGDRLGRSVSVSGDTAVLGANLEDGGGAATGSAYVFVRSAGAWTQQAKLQASDSANRDNFGVAVSVSGDTAAIGAYRDDDLGENSGSAYIFERTGTLWSQTSKLLASDGGAFDDFGWSLALDGDRLAVGAPQGIWQAGTGPGRAYTFTRKGSAWSEEAQLSAMDGTTNDFFGYSVSLAQDSVIAGAPLDDVPAIDSGSAYVFKVGDEPSQDCNGNQIEDAVDISEGTSQDCNQNAVPDECDIADGAADTYGLNPPSCAPNGVPDSCEASPDCDGDGTPDFCEIAAGAADTYGLNPPSCSPNGVPDSCEASPDCDGDGTPDFCEIAAGAADTYGLNPPSCSPNGVPDSCEASPDCDGDGTPNFCEIAAGAADTYGLNPPSCSPNGVPDSCESSPDCDGDGTPNFCEIAAGAADTYGLNPPSCSPNGVPDSCESSPDCDGDGTPDFCEIAAGAADTYGLNPPSCSPNGVPDSCESSPDCDGDGTPDFCEIAAGAADTYGLNPPSCSPNGVPDSCESSPDCDGDGTPDFCEIAAGAADTYGLNPPSCSPNGVPDSCESSPDCDGDGTPDFCEIAAGAADVYGLNPQSCSPNGVPDSCETTADCDGDGTPDFCETPGEECGHTGTPFCFGDGSGPACPCNNVGSTGRGCNNSHATGGALLYCTGTTLPDTLRLNAQYELPSALTIFLQGNIEIASVPFGDGLRCAGGTLKRLYSRSASGGATFAPQPGNPSISARSAALGDPISRGSIRIYQTYYRDPSATFCPTPPGSTFNSTNAVRIQW